MNSWAKVIDSMSKEGFEFWGSFTSMKVYKNGKLIGVASSLKQLKMLVK